MHRRIGRFGGAVTVLAAMLAVQQASAAETPPVEKAEGSAFVQCDGSPAGHTGAEIAGRLLLIMATSGLAGAGEMPNKDRRLTGVDAVAACDKAMTSESIPSRLVELSAARAIHYLEAKDYEAALKAARDIPSVAGAEAADPDFQRSILLSAMEIEAAALVRLGKPAEAEAVALKMAERAPYDVVTVQRAARYIGLTPEMTPAKAAFYDRFVHLFPSGLNNRAELREWAGDYAGSAADMGALMKVRTAFAPDDLAAVEVVTPVALARQAVAMALSGKVEESAAIADKARAAVEVALRTGKAQNEGVDVNKAEELLDFHRIIALQSQGKLAEARVAFGAKSRWLAPYAPAVALMTERLRAGAAPAEVTGALARDPAQLRADGMAARASTIVEDPKAMDVLYGSIRRPLKASDYRPFTNAVWNTTKSRYMVKRKPKDRYKGEFIMLTSNYSAATGEALLLHAALMAQARGKTGFMVTPGRKYLEATTVIFGNPTDPEMEPLTTFDAASVIRDLSPVMPQPVKR